MAQNRCLRWVRYRLCLVPDINALIARPNWNERAQLVCLSTVTRVSSGGDEPFEPCPELFRGERLHERRSLAVRMIWKAVVTGDERERLLFSDGSRSTDSTGSRYLEMFSVHPSGRV
jgi:hypothetical protein